MLTADIIRYWYSFEVPKSPHQVKLALMTTADAFSVPLLWRTLFAPWRRDIVAAANSSLPERLRAAGFNLVAVLVGIFVRLFVLTIASAVLVFEMTAGVVFLILWAVLPFLIPVLAMVGLIFLIR